MEYGVLTCHGGPKRVKKKKKKGKKAWIVTWPSELGLTKLHYFLLSCRFLGLQLLLCLLTTYDTISQRQKGHSPDKLILRLSVWWETDSVKMKSAFLKCTPMHWCPDSQVNDKTSPMNTPWAASARSCWRLRAPVTSSSKLCLFSVAVCWSNNTHWRNYRAWWAKSQTICK